MIFTLLTCLTKKNKKNNGWCFGKCFPRQKVQPVQSDKHNFKMKRESGVMRSRTWLFGSDSRDEISQRRRQKSNKRGIQTGLGSACLWGQKGKSSPGRGLRRLEWGTNIKKAAAQGAALRLLLLLLLLLLHATGTHTHTHLEKGVATPGGENSLWIKKNKHVKNVYPVTLTKTLLYVVIIIISCNWPCWFFYLRFVFSF